MTISITAPLVPATPWNYGASVPYASFGIGQDLKVVLSPGNDSTIVAVYLSASPISAGTLPAHNLPPPGAILAGVCFSGEPTLIVPDQETRANAHILLGRLGAGTNAATVAVAGQRAGTGIASSVPSGWSSSAPSFATTSATFVDVTGATTGVTTTVDCEVFTVVSVQYSGANNLVGQVRITIGAQTSDAITIDGTNAVEYTGVTFRTTGLTAGTYAAQLQARKVSGSGSVTIDNADILVVAMQATGGA